MHAQDEMDIQALKAGSDTGKPKNIKIKHFQPTGGNQKEIIARSASSLILDYLEKVKLGILDPKKLGILDPKKLGIL
ncbi:hypothetical protein AVEN_52013-1, partial [Araneus ventricosus]